jgi:hypothetical protein
MKKILFGILVLLTIIVIVMIIGWSNPQFQYGNSITIERAPVACYNILSDTTQIRKWMPGFRHQRLLKGEHQKPGAEYMLVIEDGEVMTMYQRVTEWNAPEKMGYVLTNDVLTSTYSYSLRGDFTQTVVSTSYVVEGNNVFMKAILFFSKSLLAESRS